MLARITHPGLHHPRRTVLFALLFVLIAAVVGGRPRASSMPPMRLKIPPLKWLMPARRSSVPPAWSRPLA